MMIKTRFYQSIPSECPKCHSKLNHVNAIDTKAKTYIVFCTNTKCRYCQEFKKCDDCGGAVCL